MSLKVKQKRYTPDFYLFEYDLYIEIKGYWWNNDEEKMIKVRNNHKDKNLVVIFGKDKLDNICKNIKSILKEPYWTW